MLAGHSGIGAKTCLFVICHPRRHFIFFFFFFAIFVASGLDTGPGDMQMDIFGLQTKVSFAVDQSSGLRYSLSVPVAKSFS